MRPPPAPDEPSRLVEPARRVFVAAVCRGVRGPSPGGTDSAASRGRGSRRPDAAAGRCVYVASTRRSSTSSAAACSRSPSRYFCRRGNFSTVGTSHSTKRYIDSSAGPVRRAPCPVPPASATTANRWGASPPDPPRRQEKKTQELIERPRNTKPGDVEPSAGAVPVARTGTEERPRRRPRNRREPHGGCSCPPSSPQSIPTGCRPCPTGRPRWHRTSRPDKAALVSISDPHPLSGVPAAARPHSSSVGNRYVARSSGSTRTRIPARRPSSRTAPDADPSAESRGCAMNHHRPCNRRPRRRPSPCANAPYSPTVTS